MKYDLDNGKKLFAATDFDERIAKFMKLPKVGGMWEHPCEFALSDTLGFKRDWQWLMPVVTKIQSKYEFRLKTSLKEYDQTGFGIAATITIFGKGCYSYYWEDSDRLERELRKMTEEADRYEEVFKDEYNVIVESKFQAVYLCVCKFIEWWETQKEE
jgi:hypothetical protein